MRIKLLTDEIFDAKIGELNEILSVLADRLFSQIAHSLSVSLDNDKELMRFVLKAKNGDILSSSSISSPFKSVVVNAEVVDDNLKLTLNNGVSVVAPFSTILQGVATTEQLDTEIKTRERMFALFEERFFNEKILKAEQISSLQEKISLEESERKSEISKLESSVDAEKKERTEAFDSLPFFIGEDGYVYGKD